ncbi:hypothetical protein PENTCL1PPCAC_14767, partial [Pristionchus entomophagus]
AVSGAIFNCLLLILIWKFSRKEMGLYRNLLRTIAIVDIIMSIAHGITSPRAFVIDFTFAVTPRSLLVSPSRELMIGYSSLFTLPFYVMNIHFLYRYWNIKSPGRLFLFANKPFIFMLVAIGAAAVALWAGLMTMMGSGHSMDEFQLRFDARYKATNDGAWVTMDYKKVDGQWNHRIIVLMCVFDGLAIVQAFLSVVLSSLTFYHIHIASTVSASSKLRQRKLLVALCMQTFVPVICVYIPYLGLITSPILRLAMGSFPDLCPVFIASFPLWDALVIMLVIKDFRQG